MRLQNGGVVERYRKPGVYFADFYESEVLVTRKSLTLFIKGLDKASVHTFRTKRRRVADPIHPQYNWMLMINCDRTDYDEKQAN